MTVIDAYQRALRQLPDPAFRRVLLIALAIAVVVFGVLLALALWGTGQVPAESLSGWLRPVVEWAGGIATLVVAWFAFPIVITGALGFFIDDIADSVERRHYPLDTPGRGVAFLPGLALGIRFAGLALAINILVLPLYLISFLVPPFGPFLFYAVNGYLLGREYFGQIGLRHAPARDVRRLARTHRWRIFLAGLVGAFVLTLPVLNLLAPLVATAAMVHLWKDIAGPGRGAQGR
jgi:uncharacterized protein involved in cysteine biosynthesis